MDDGAAAAVGAGRGAGAAAAAALLSSLLVALPLRCAGGARRGSRPAVGGWSGACSRGRGWGAAVPRRRPEASACGAVRGAVVPEPCRVGAAAGMQRHGRAWVRVGGSAGVSGGQRGSVSVGCLGFYSAGEPLSSSRLLQALLLPPSRRGCS